MIIVGLATSAGYGALDKSGVLPRPSPRLCLRAHRSGFNQLVTPNTRKEGIMIRRVNWTIAIPVLLWIAPGDSAFAASTSMACSDGKVVSVSTGTQSGSCTQSTNPTGSFFTCTDGGNVTSGGCGSDGKSVCGSSNGAANCGIGRRAVLPPGTKRAPLQKLPPAAGAVQGR
jgi:hypothetical protein